MEQLWYLKHHERWKYKHSTLAFRGNNLMYMNIQHKPHFYVCFPIHIFKALWAWKYCLFLTGYKNGSKNFINLFNRIIELGWSIVEPGLTPWCTVHEKTGSGKEQSKTQSSKKKDCIMTSKGKGWEFDSTINKLVLEKGRELHWYSAHLTRAWV